MVNGVPSLQVVGGRVLPAGNVVAGRTVLIADWIAVVVVLALYVRHGNGLCYECRCGLARMHRPRESAILDNSSGSGMLRSGITIPRVRLSAYKRRCFGSG